MTDRLQRRLEEIGAPDDVKELAAELAELAVRDPLTGLFNRRFFDAALAKNIEAARRYNHPLSLVLFDLDRLKELNDTSGHEAGDRALRTFADVLSKTARAADIVCRIAGDEFAVILPETALSNVRNFTDRVSRKLMECGGLPPLFESISSSASCGKESAGKPAQSKWILSATSGAAALPSDTLFADADAELLQRKAERKFS